MSTWIKTTARSISQLFVLIHEVVGDVLRAVWDFAQSTTTQRNIIRTILIVITAAIQVGLAVVAYLIFYNRFLPDQVTTIPLYLQYGYGENPFALAAITSQNLKTDQAYDISVSLTLPPSPVNQAKGNFMVTLRLLDTADGRVDPAGSPRSAGEPNKEQLLKGTDILETYRRPLIVPYADPIVVLASRLLFLPFSVLRRTPKEDVVLAAVMANNAPFGESGRMPTLVFLEVEAGQTLQVYESAVTLTAQLSGPRWIMHHYWLSSFLVLTSLFWVVEILFTVVAWVALSYIVGTRYELGESPHQEASKLLHPVDDNDRVRKTGRVEPVVVKKEMTGESDDDSIASIYTIGGANDPNVRGSGAQVPGRPSDDNGQLRQRRSQGSMST